MRELIALTIGVCLDGEGRPAAVTLRGADNGRRTRFDPMPPLLGLLMLDTHFPRLPGDVGHSSTFRVPVLRRVVHGASARRVVREADRSLIEPFVDAAHQLVAQGATAITTSCGFLVRWQDELQAAVTVPVWTSSLLELPRLAHPGVITVDVEALGADCLQAAGAPVDTPVQGLARGCSLQRTLLEDLPTLDAVQAEADVVAAARELVWRHPGIESVVLECTNLPPYAAAVGRATGRPVHHLVTMIHERLAGLQRAADVSDR